MTLNGNFCTGLVPKSFLLLLVILHRRSRFVDSIGHLGQTISLQKRVLNDTFHGSTYFWSNAQTTFFFEFDSLLTFELESFCTCLKISPRVLLYQQSLLSNLLLWQFYLLIFTFYLRILLAISCFVLTVLGLPGGDLADIVPLVKRVYHL